ncbi:gamma-glutamyl-gamma-aminobutyrate hydrolase family protein [Leekyejoonella antrihumi]|uniref:Gamma-glutamyl-gamma-aminobutyrate hydrolase family protein n=1 Tax=Leekyejoonella antrihumi TaxID=1660198 RepID=A0A563DQS5_9MICO|nr:type 1 glutamine amidotransferase [Leekyejoonella antrihumi]TWP32575.1 gamma-glutamyl-gamma-aminobutyrate hydrolase family protein [Leekyejoonella antrihumi]
MPTGLARARRPLIAVPARFTETASALRFRGEVLPRTLVEAIYSAGGEPLVVHPDAPGGAECDPDVAERLAFADGVVLPGGGDISPTWTGSAWHATQYGVDIEQDGFDLALARWAVDAGIPLLAICRGMQVLNVALGGTLRPDMNDPGLGLKSHVGQVHPVTVLPGSTLSTVVGDNPTVSCYHHQCVSTIAPKLRAVATSLDGTVEALEPALGQVAGWTLAVQWHPEDTATTDPTQMRLFGALVSAAQQAAHPQSPTRPVSSMFLPDPEKGTICQ